jgi:hypothetical protein
MRVIKYQIKEDEMDGTCSTHEKDVKCIQNFCQKSEGQRPPRRCRCSREDSIRLGLREVGWEDVD